MVPSLKYSEKRRTSGSYFAHGKASMNMAKHIAIDILYLSIYSSVLPRMIIPRDCELTSTNLDMLRKIRINDPVYQLLACAQTPDFPYSLGSKIKENRASARRLKVRLHTAINRADFVSW